MKLNIYFGKKVISHFCVIFVIFLVFFIIFNWVDILGFEFSRSHSPIKLLYFAILKSPITVQPLMPIVILLTSIAFFISLSRTGELIIIRAAGRSVLRSLTAPIFAIFAIGIFIIFLINPLNSLLYKLYEAELIKIDKMSANVSINENGIWLREGNVDGQKVIQAKKVNENTSSLFDITIFNFDKNRIPVSRINAESAVIEKNAWTLLDGKIWRVNRNNRPEERAQKFQKFTFKTDLNIKKIMLGFGEPYQISLWDLKEYIIRIERAGFSSLKHRVYMNSQIALPLLMVGMFLIGGALNMGHARIAKSGLMAIISIVLGISAFLLGNLTEILSQNGAIPVSIGAWSPPIIISFIALGLILHLEDG